MSLDGKIADQNGSTDWLDQIPNPGENDYGYATLIESVDTTIMGNSTYQQIRSFPIPFPYSGLNNYVLTRNKSLENDEYVTFLSADFDKAIKALKHKKGKDIWLIGGSQINKMIHDYGMIDEYIIFVMPIILGSGISLFDANPDKATLRLTASKTYDSGVVELKYHSI